MTATITELPSATRYDIHLDRDQTDSFIAAVKATAVAASTDAVRDILTNVLVIIERGEIKLVATDSYQLYVTTLGFVTLDAGIEATFMIRAKQFVAAMPKGKPVLHLLLNVDDRQLVITNVLDATGTTLAHQPGTFPQWENLINNEPVTDALTVGMNPTKVADIAKAAKLFAGRTDMPIMLRTGATELKPMYWEMNVRDRGTFFALLMPVRMP